MPHVSKQKIDKVVYTQFFNELEKLIAKSNPTSAPDFLNTLLTKTERTMITKRLAAALMFDQGSSQYKVWTTLKISPSTSSRMSLDYENGKYNKILRILRKSNNRQFWELLEKISRGGLPPMGKNRWRSLPK